MTHDPWRKVRAKATRNADQLKENERARKEVERQIYMDQPSTKCNARIRYVRDMDIEMLEKLKKSEAERQIKETTKEREERLSKALRDQNTEIENATRRRIWLRETVPELRELATKLRGAYVQSVLVNQVALKEHEKIKQIEEELPFSEIFKEHERQDKIQMEKKAFEKMEARKELLSGLQHQMKHHVIYGDEQVKEEIQKERDQVDRILKENMEAMQLEKDTDKAKKAKLHSWFTQRWKDKADLNQLDRQRMAEEQERIDHFNRFKENRERDFELRQQAIKDKHHATQDELSRKLCEIDAQRRQLASECQEVSELEAELRMVERGDNVTAHKLEVMESLQRSHQEHLAFKAAQQAEELAEKKEYWAHLMAQQAADDAKQKEREKRSALSKQEFREELEKHTAERRRAFEENVRQERLQHELVGREDKKLKAEVAAERLAMIYEVAPHLLPGSIGRNVINRDDYDTMDEALKKELFPVSNWPPNY